MFLLGTKEILQQQTGRYLVKTFHRLMKTTSTPGKDTNGKSESVLSPRTMYLSDCLPFLQQAFVKSRAGVSSAQDSVLDLNALVKYVTKMQQQHMVENNENMIELSKEFNQNIARKLVVDYDVITHLIVTHSAISYIITCLPPSDKLLDAHRKRAAWCVAMAAKAVETQTQAASLTGALP